MRREIQQAIDELVDKRRKSITDIDELEKDEQEHVIKMKERINTNIESMLVELEDWKEQRKQLRISIKKWTSEFVREHQRQPTEEDKRNIQEKYDQYLQYDNKIRHLKEELRMVKETYKKARIVSHRTDSASFQLLNNELSEKEPSEIEEAQNDSLKEMAIPPKIDAAHSTIASPSKTMWSFQPGQVKTECVHSPKKERINTLRSKFQSIVEEEKNQNKEDIHYTKIPEIPEPEITSDSIDIPESIQLDESEKFLLEETVPEALSSQDYTAINILKDEIYQRQIPDYATEFENVVPETELVVASVDIEDIKLREKEIEDARIRQNALEVEEYRRREAKIALNEEQAKRRLHEESVQAKEKLVQKEIQSMQVVQLKEAHLGHIFRKAEDHMRKVISQQNAHVQETYGEMLAGNKSVSRRYRLDWQKLPQPVQIRLYMLRAVKDKLPRGHYCIIVTLYDRLGGHPLSWSVLGEHGAGTNRPGVTRPFLHRGAFYNSELHINQDIYATGPSQFELRPANVFIFELYLLCGKNSSTDQVVGWGCLPVTNPSFKIVQGRFKIPFLRGELDVSMDKYQDIEDLYKDDLSCWLCNLYLEVTPLPREQLDQDGVLQREYDIEIDFNNQLLKLEHTDRKIMNRSEPEAKVTPFPDNSFKNEASFKRIRSMNDATSSSVKQRHRSQKNVDSAALFSCPENQSLSIEIPDSEEKKKQPKKWSKSLWKKKKTKRRKKKQASIEAIKKLEVEGSGTSDYYEVSEDDEQSFLLSPKRKLVTQSPWASHSNEDGDDDNGATCTSVTLVESQQLEQFKFAVNGELEVESAVHRRFQSSRKMRYIKQELLTDLGLKKYYTFEFWAMVGFLFFTIWLRMYVHYLGEWLYLRGMKVPVYDFRPQITTCLLKYTAKSVPTHIEIGVVMMGIMANIGTFLFLSFIAWACQQLLGFFPNLGSRFIACYGIATLLDPLLVLAVDLIQHNYNCRLLSECFNDLAATTCRCVEGDAFKLYSRFYWEEGSGVVGVFLTVIIYIALCCLSGVLFYNYLLNIHMNGRMLDVYRRIHSHDHNFFLPHDFEITMNEVKLLCEKAKRWIGPKGNKRNVSVCEYTLHDPLDPIFKETTTHISIYNLELDGSKQLYRHFILNAEGLLMEVFGDLSIHFGGQYSALEKLLLSTREDSPESSNPACAFATL